MTMIKGACALLIASVIIFTIILVVTLNAVANDKSNDVDAPPEVVPYPWGPAPSYKVSSLLSN